MVAAIHLASGPRTAAEIATECAADIPTSSMYRTLAILDETDSGLDIDALRVVSEGVNTLRNEDRAFLVITHYQRLLNHIVPDEVHVLVDGRIVRSGPRELALELEEKGYSWLEGATAA